MNWEYQEPPSVHETDGYKKVVLVTGSREWDDPQSIEDVLDFISPHVVIHGSAAGADWIADRWARRILAQREPFKIPDHWWETYGKRAGPLRNGYMIERLMEWERRGHKVLVVAFPRPEGSGTLDCIEQAVIQNLPVLVYQ